MPEVESEIEGVETEKRGRHPEERRALRKLLKRLANKNKEIAIIIRSGQNCCRQTGCIAEVTDHFVVLLDENDACRRTHILLDCICAVKNFVCPN